MGRVTVGVAEVHTKAEFLVLCIYLCLCYAVKFFFSKCLVSFVNQQKNRLEFRDIISYYSVRGTGVCMSVVP